MARPKGSTNKPKTASDAQMLQKASTRIRPSNSEEVPQAKILKKPTKVVGHEEDIVKVNKMLSSFESIEADAKPKEEAKEESTFFHFDSVEEFFEAMNLEAMKKNWEDFPPEVKVEHLEKKVEFLEDKVKRLNRAIKKLNVVIDYLETKLGIDE